MFKKKSNDFNIVPFKIYMEHYEETMHVDIGADKG